MNVLLQKLGLSLEMLHPLTGGALIFTRILVITTLAPFLGGRGFTGRFRLIISIILAAFVFFVLPTDWIATVPKEPLRLLALFFKEIFFGICIGMVCLMCFYAIEAAGRVVDNQRGSANAQIFVPQLGQVSIFGLFTYWFGLALFCSIGGHVIFLQALIESFVSVPVTNLPAIANGFSPFLTLIIRLSADVLILGVKLATPVLITIFLADMVLGIASKMAPQIQVFELGFVLKGYLGVLLVYLALMAMASQMQTQFDLLAISTQKIIRYFSQ